MIQEVPDFAVSLAHQGDHRNVRGVVFAHCAEKSTLADTAPAEYADPLSFAARQNTVDRSDARGQAFGDMFSFQRIGRPPIKGIAFVLRYPRARVHRLAESIENTPQKRRRHRHARVFAPRDDGIIHLQPVNLFKRHRYDSPVAESDHLRFDPPAAEGLDLTEIADSDGRPAGFHEKAGNI